MKEVDVVVIGAGFSGLTFAHHLSNKYRVLILDRKSKLNAAIESTGLITEVTKNLFADFTDIEAFLPNHITTISVVSPDYNKYFFSHTDKPWIYSTDTPEFLKHMSETLPDNVDLKLESSFIDYSIEPDHDYPVKIKYNRNGSGQKEIRCKFIVGADGVNSKLAQVSTNLSVNKKLLVGYEKVFYGDINLGDHPDNTVYHFWFGEFSLGYGGWLSPTIINGKKAFRLGLAKLEKDKDKIHLLEKFIEKLKDENIVKIDEENKLPIHTFAHSIPIGGVLPSLYDDYSILIGDAAGFCGAFAADGIKGSIISGKVSAKLIPKYLEGEKNIFGSYLKEMNKSNHLISYYRRQQLYRVLWNRMKSNRSFHALYNLIEREKEGFLNQFCDNMTKKKGLTRVILKLKNIPALGWYAISLFLDLFKR